MAQSCPLRGRTWGSKNCSYTEVAKHPGYVDFRQCNDYFDELTPEVGRHTQVTGISSWGIVRENFRVLR